MKNLVGNIFKKKSGGESSDSNVDKKNVDKKNVTGSQLPKHLQDQINNQLNSQLQKNRNANGDLDIGMDIELSNDMNAISMNSMGENALDENGVGNEANGYKKAKAGKKGGLLYRYTRRDANSFYTDENVFYVSFNFLFIFLNIIFANIPVFYVRDLDILQKIDYSLGFLNFIMLSVFMVFISIYINSKTKFLQQMVNHKDKDGMAKEFLTFFNIRIFIVSFICILCISLIDFAADFNKFSKIETTIEKELVNASSFIFAMSSYIIFLNSEFSKIRKRLKIEYISKTELDIYYINRNFIQSFIGLIYLISSSVFISSYYEEVGVDNILISQGQAMLYYLLYYFLVCVIYLGVSSFLDLKNRDRYIRYISKLNDATHTFDFSEYKLFIHNFDDYGLFITEYNEVINSIERKDREYAKNLGEIYRSFDKSMENFLMFKEDFSHQITLLNNMYSDMASLSNVFKSIEDKLLEQKNDFALHISTIVDSERSFAELIMKLKSDMKNIQNRSDDIQSDTNYIYNMLVNVEEITNHFTGMSSKIKDASKMFHQINDFLNQINDISEKTNLLSVNASIEAARAGVAGEGFSVIANEVQSLSESTGYTINNISGVINNTKEIIDASLEIIDNSERAIQNNRDNNTKAKTTIDSFERSMTGIIQTMVEYYYNVESKNNEFKDFVGKIETLGKYFDILNKSFREHSSHYNNMNYRITKINENNKKISENLENIFLELRKVSEKKEMFRKIID